MKPRTEFTRYTLLLASLVILLAGCQGEAGLVPTTPPSADDYASVIPARSGQITALGIVRPATTLALSFTAGGPLASLRAAVGLEVHEGGLLARLDTAALILELESAGQDVILTQAALEARAGPPDPGRVAQVEAEHAAEVAAAELALEIAEGQAVEAENARELALREAEAAVERARLALEIAQNSGATNTAATIAAVRLEQTESALTEAQKAYDRAWDTARDWESYMTEPTAPYPGAPATGPSLSSQLEAERPGSERALAAAKAALAIAQAEYRGALAAGSDQGYQLQVLQADLPLAELRLESLSAGADTTSAAAVAQAELELDRLAAWQNPLLEPAPAEEIVTARARLRQAELVVERLELELGGAELIAPFDSLIAVVHAQPGEWVTPGMPVVELIDTGRWLVETRNVGELTIGRVAPGMKATVRVNAHSGETLNGRIVAISPVAVVQQGDTTYTLTIELAPTKLDLRSGMTAQVEILLE